MIFFCLKNFFALKIVIHKNGILKNEKFLMNFFSEQTHPKDIRGSRRYPCSFLPSREGPQRSRKRVCSFARCSRSSRLVESLARGGASGSSRS